MSWVIAARFVKIGTKPDVSEPLMSAKKHWEDAALDVGMDPEKNVTTEEGEREARVYISEELDMQYREEAGGWRMDVPGNTPE